MVQRPHLFALWYPVQEYVWREERKTDDAGHRRKVCISFLLVFRRRSHAPLHSLTGIGEVVRDIYTDFFGRSLTLMTGPTSTGRPQNQTSSESRSFPWPWNSPDRHGGEGGPLPRMGMDNGAECSRKFLCRIFKLQFSYLYRSHALYSYSVLPPSRRTISLVSQITPKPPGHKISSLP